MKFTYDTLSSTSRRFGSALEARGLSLTLSTTQNMWTQIVAGKNFSAAKSMAKAQGHLVAAEISTKLICQKFLERNRCLDAGSAVKVFADAVSDDLPTLSYCMSCLLALLQVREHWCLKALVSEPITGLGIIEPDRAGYTPVGNLNMVEGREQEAAWLRANNYFVADVLNTLAGRTDRQCIDMGFANIRAQGERENQAFADFVGEHVDTVSSIVAQRILSVLHPADPNLWENLLDFDDLNGIVFDVFDSEFRKTQFCWLRADCNLGEAVIDHVAARARLDLRMFADPDFLRANPEPSAVFVSSAKFAIRTILDVRQ